MLTVPASPAWAASALLVALLLGVVPAQAAERGDGEGLYLENCAGCHGVEGDGAAWGPSIRDDGLAGNHFWMATGRMPIRRPDDPIRPREPILSEDQIQAILSYLDPLVEGPEIPDVDPDRGELSEGLILYIDNCAACHGTSGVGGALVQARNATDLFDIDPRLIAEAIRSGPGPMPRFDESVIDEDDLDSVVRYVLFLQEGETHGGWDLGGWGPVAEGAAAWFLGIGGALLAAYWVERTGHHPEPREGHQ